MPGRQRLSRCTQAIGAAWRQPRDIVYDPRGQPQAIGHEGLAVAIVAAPRARDVEQPASDVGFGDFTGILVFELMQRSEEHTSELQSLMRISYAVFCLKKKRLSN